MPKATMTAVEDQTDGWPDGGVPSVQLNPPRPVTCCQEHKDVEVGTVLKGGKWDWVVRGWDKETGRLWVREANGMTTKWFRECSVDPPACTAEESPVCTCGFSANGFHADPDDPTMWVHVECGKPTALYVKAQAARAGMLQW